MKTNDSGPELKEKKNALHSIITASAFFLSKYFYACFAFRFTDLL